MLSFKRDIHLVYARILGRKRDSPGEILNYIKEGLEFGKKEYDEIDRFCKENKIDWFASAWDLNNLKFLEQYKLKYNK